MVNHTIDEPHFGPHQLFLYPYSSKYLLLCSAKEEKNYSGWEQLEGE